MVAPGIDERRRLPVEGDHPHDHRAESVGLAQGDRELGHTGLRLRREHARPAAQDRLAFGLAARHDARVVGEEDERQVERVGDGDEVGRLVRPVGVERAGEELGLVGHHGDGMAAEAGQDADQRPAEARLHLEAGSLVEDDVDDVAHVVHPPAVAGNDVQQFGHGSEARRRPARHPIGYDQAEDGKYRR